MSFISSNGPHLLAALNVIYIIKWATSSGAALNVIYIFKWATSSGAALNVIYIIKWATSSGAAQNVICIIKWATSSGAALNVIIIKWATSSGCTKCHLYHQMGHIFWLHKMSFISSNGPHLLAALNVMYIIKWATSSGCTKCHLYHQMGHIFWLHKMSFISSNGPHLLAALNVIEEASTLYFKGKQWQFVLSDNKYFTSKVVDRLFPEAMSNELAWCPFSKEIVEKHRLIKSLYP